MLQVSVINIDGPSLLYQKHIASEISTGIISLQFITCSVYGFAKNILAVGTKDSSVLVLDSETGNTLKTGTGAVRPKNPSKALFMQILGKSLQRDQLSKHTDISYQWSECLFCLAFKCLNYFYDVVQMDSVNQLQDQLEKIAWIWEKGIMLTVQQQRICTFCCVLKRLCISIHLSMLYWYGVLYFYPYELLGTRRLASWNYFLLF